MRPRPGTTSTVYFNQGEPGGATPSPSPAPAPAPEPAPAPAASPSPAPAAGATPSPSPAPSPTPAQPEKDWKMNRIDQLTAQLNEERRLRAAAVVPAPTPKPGETEADFQAQVDAAANEKAGQIAAVQDWNSRCNSVADKGKAEFPDFAARLGAIQGVINNQDAADVTQYNEVLASAMETGHAHKVLHELGENPGQFRELMNLSPVKRAQRLATMTAKYAPPESEPDPSWAPKPITPVGGRGVHYDGIKPDDPTNGTKLPIGEWMKQREKQAEAAGIQ